MKINGPYGFKSINTNGGSPIFSIIDRDDQEVICVDNEDLASLITRGLTCLYENWKEV